MPKTTDLHGRVTGALADWDDNEPAIPKTLPRLPVPGPRRAPEAVVR